VLGGIVGLEITAVHAAQDSALTAVYLNKRNFQERLRLAVPAPKELASLAGERARFYLGL
jgi:hypothetical protein